MISLKTTKKHCFTPSLENTFCGNTSERGLITFPPAFFKVKNERISKRI